MTPQDARFADAAIRLGFVSFGKLSECAGQISDGQGPALKDLLLERGYLSRTQAAEILRVLERKEAGQGRPPEEEDHRFCELLIRRGLLSFQSVHDAVRLREKWKRGSVYLKTIEEILVEHNLLTPVQIRAIREETEVPRVMIPPGKDSALGQLALREGYITDEQLHEALRIQRGPGHEPHQMIGEVLLQKGYLTPERLDELLSLHAMKTIGIDIPGYTVLKRIGKGGMGEVFQARQLSVDRLVAIKVLNDDLSGDRAYVEQFLREAKLCAGLDHPFIVKAIDAGTIHGKTYFIMEYIDGKTAEALLEEKRRLPERDAVKIGQYVARGLEYAHKHKLIHRDIKPSNIMLNREGVVKLCDLGLARRVDGSETPHATTMVSGEYVAPEVVLGQRVDIRADIYSLGATLFHLATGQPLFDDPNLEKLCEMQVSSPPRSPHRLNPDLSEDFSLVVLKTLRKKPEDRYQDPTALARDLSLLLRRKPLLDLRKEDVRPPRR